MVGAEYGFLEWDYMLMTSPPLVRSQYSIECKIKNLAFALLRRYNRLHLLRVGRNST